MDSVIHSSLEEICCESSNGLQLRNLWNRISSSLSTSGLPLNPNVKRAVWRNLVEIPGLKFEACDNGADSAEEEVDWSKCTVEVCEERNVKIVAPEAMRKSFLGIYEIEALESSLSDTQRFILQRLTVARTNGVAQSDLAKELRIAPKNLFYPLKRLETLGLIVRLPTVIRKKQTSNSGEPKPDSIVHTNMLYLHRYGKHLGCQQRLEISKDDKLLMGGEVGDVHAEASDDFGVEVEKEDVHVKDFLPALKAICDKLEKADSRVLVVSDIKRDLGYRMSSGHRAWRNICHRLKEAKVVEECCTMVKNKTVNCLRLLQSFSPSLFEQKFHGRKHDDVDMEQPTSSVKRGQITEQLVELPILRQIYDIIDAAGSKGITNTEVCRALGFGNKEYHKRYFNQRIFRFGLHSHLEIHNRCEVYRLFTARNFNKKSSNMFPDESETVLQEVTEPKSYVVDHDFYENLSQPMPMHAVDTLTSMVNVESTNDIEHDAPVSTEASSGTNKDGEGKSCTLLQWNPLNTDAELCDRVPDQETLPVNKSVTDNALQEKSPSAAVTVPRRRSHLRYPSLTMGATSLEREQHILRMLEEEKFLIKPELHRRLESLEMQKNTMMDRKTLERSLNKLQQEGHCKCIRISIPVVTNCGRSRTTVVVLHPSVYDKLTELLSEIHDRLRNFEIQVRKQSPSQQMKGQSVAILENVKRIPISIGPEVQSEHAEVMRANGFVPAKMVRTKLLHIFLWGWVSKSPGWNDALLSSDNPCDLKNPHSTCEPFELDTAIKSMPIELFLQAVGSGQNFVNLVEKCRSGLRLSDLPKQEYNCLMDTRASGRLSWLIDILRRLKLIRLVSKGHGEDRAESPQATLTHALELKPYIEEPVSTFAGSGFLFPDLRPQIRHDFVLSSREALDEYWNTLEYCYATAKPRAAELAFPGMAVHEVFRSRSWASVRVMTASQRAELLEHVAKDDSSKKLSRSMCEKIAKELNLTLEQVLRVYYDKRQRRRTRFQRVSGAEGKKNETVNGKTILSPCKRKRDSGGASFKVVKAAAVDRESSLQTNYTGDDIEGPAESEEEDKEASTSIRKRLSKLDTSRQKRFSWTEEADRKLVIEYARHRAALGAKFNRVDWASISSLPAHPDTCRRRMSSLNSCIPFRKAVMKLCGMLGYRYAKYLEIFPDKVLNHVDFGKNVQDYAFEGDTMCDSSSKSGKWDDFEENNIKAALDDALRHKRMAKLEAAQDTLSDQDNEDYEDCGGIKASSHRSSSRKLPRKYVKLFNEGGRVRRQMHESVAIANAAELFKLIFLSSSKAPEVPTLLAETLRRYSEHDLFSAFNYLREKKIMIGGSCNSPFMLSQQFLNHISPNILPRDTGKRAAKFVSWLREREKDLMEEGLDVPSDLQYGEIFSLCAMVSSGELLITPCLPDDGVGEAEDNRTSKRKYNCSEPDGGEIYKKPKTSLPGEGDITPRREKGFPGIKLCLTRERISRSLAIESFSDKDVHPTKSFGERDERIALSDLNVDCMSPHSDVADYVREILDSGESTHLALDTSESPWEAMRSYAEYIMSSCSYQVRSPSLHPDLFKSLYSAIQKSGDHGLSMKEISELLNIEDENMLDIMIEVLEAFRRAFKVNAYDSTHVVDSLYRSKYFLTSDHSHTVAHPRSPKRINKDGYTPVNLHSPVVNSSASENETSIIGDEVHRITILNLSGDVDDPPEVPSMNKKTGSEHSETTSQKNTGVDNVEPLSSYTQTCRPLLPWMNGDGTVNEIVYKRLISHVLHIVMQNPGILEDGVIREMRFLNPQSCRNLLDIMIMDNHIITRKLQQKTSTQPPSILGSLLSDRFTKSKMVCRVHLFANPMSTSFL